MDTPICVTDAKTLIDHIQDVKRWIYSGQIRLVVPSSTIEYVEQLYQKSVESKPTPPEPTRPRSFGRQPKKEHPAFDINPRLARDFLARIKTLKGSDDSVVRDFYSRKENHDAVEFQQPSEQYTAWKDIENDVEETEPTVAPPTSWAEALRRKTNLTNGIAEDSQVAKGPVKPKLVARAQGSDQSPWKIRKDAPKIPAKDVPGTLRPIMSCVLWRLHEHINRNDINELFFLTDQSELRITAEKLNVAVRSVQELKQLLASETKVDNIATLGDLEREFGIQQRTSGSADLNGLTSVSSEDKIAPPLADGMVKSHDDTSRLSSNGKHDRHDGNGAYRKGEFQTEEQEDGTISNGPGDDQASPVLVKANEECTAEKPSAESAITLTKVSTATKPPWNAVVRGDSYETNHTLSNGEQINGHVLGTSHGTMPQDDFSRDSQEKLEISPSSPSTEKLPSYFDAVKPSLATQEQQSQVSPLQSSLSTLVSTPVQSCQLEIEPEDSDEEVVVFKPSAKRYSTQKKPAQQNVKPSTPKTSSQPKTSTPRIQPQQPPSQPKSLTPVIEPKQQLSNGTPVPAVLKLPPQPATGSSHGRHTVAVSHGHPQSKSSPMVIDPDAFGRSFAVNTNSSPRTLQHPRSHHHARTPVQNSQNPQASRSSRREHQRTTSNHHIPHEDSQRLSPAPEPRAETSPRMSPRRRPRPFEPEASVPKTFDPTPGAGRRPTTPASKNGDFDDFVSRSAFPEAQLKPQVIQARPVDPAEIAARSGNTESVAKKILSPPDSFEHTGGFVSRSAMSQPLYKPRASEPEYIEPRASMPDVEYVLKSGSTRGSARGHGRLWTPS